MKAPKFRAWLKDARRMENVVELRWLGEGDPYLFTEHEDGHIGEVGTDGYVLMMGTGLTDRAGREIFEGDIITDTVDPEGTKLEVLWVCGIGFLLRRHDNKCIMRSPGRGAWNYIMKVTGHVYEQ